MNAPAPADLAERLSRRLDQALPAEAARRRFAPRLCFGRHCGPPACDARPAAVMVLLYRDHDCWRVALTLRPESMADHAGQVCFPGGSLDTGETSRQAALRELREELCVEIDNDAILGPLSDIYVFATNYQVTPWLAVIDRRPDFSPAGCEVAELVEMPLTALLDEERYGEHLVQRRGISFQTPHIAYDRHRIWGATCMILGELIALLGDLDAESPLLASTPPEV